MYRRVQYSTVKHDRPFISAFTLIVVYILVISINCWFYVSNVFLSVIKMASFSFIICYLILLTASCHFSHTNYFNLFNSLLLSLMLSSLISDSSKCSYFSLFQIPFFYSCRIWRFPSPFQWFSAGTNSHFIYRLRSHKYKCKFKYKREKTDSGTLSCWPRRQWPDAYLS